MKQATIAMTSTARIGTKFIMKFFMCGHYIFTTNAKTTFDKRLIKLIKWYFNNR